MATLKDGRFLFVHAERQHLFIEKPSAAAHGPRSSDLTPVSVQLLFGGTVHAFMLNAAQSRIAMICPTESAAATVATSAASLHADAPQTVLRLFSFAECEVGELLDEVVTTAAQNVVWVGDRYIGLDVRQPSAAALTSGLDVGSALASPPASSSARTSTMLFEVVKPTQKLKMVREDKAAGFPAAGPGSVLCDIHTATQKLRFWDLQRNKTTSECALPNRKCRHGKARAAMSTSSDGPFVCVVNDDMTVNGFYVARRGSVHAPKPMLTQFESQAAGNHIAKPTHAEAAGQVDGEAAEEEQRSAVVPQPPSPSPLTAGVSPRLFVRAVSDTQVLLALSGSSTILQCAFDVRGKEEEWSVVARMRLPRRFHSMGEVVALSKKSCLVRHLEAVAATGDTAVAAAAGYTSTYYVLPLDMKPTGKAEVHTAAQQPPQQPVEENHEAAAQKAAGSAEKGSASGAVEDGADAAPAEGKRKRKKKSKSGESAATDAAETPQGGTHDGKHTSTSGAERSHAGGPTQRAVDRLLVHAGIATRERLPQAFAKAEDDAAAVDNHDAAAVEGQRKAAPSPPPLRRHNRWLTAEVMVTAGGVVLGMALGICVMRKLSLL